jgi:hypothetical protein
MINDERNCEKCKFWDSTNFVPNSDDLLQGTCRRHPPIAGELNNDGYRAGFWPDTDYWDWCGEWVYNGAKP